MTASAIEGWLVARGARSVVEVEAPAAGGHSNELRFLSVDGRGVVVRSAPAGDRLFPEYDLATQVAAQSAAAAGGVPVVVPDLVDGRHLVMPLVEGRHTGDAPALCPWVLALSAAEQRALEEAFLDALATVHRVPPPGGLPRHDLGWWRRFVRWAFDGDDLAVLGGLLDRCAATEPAPPPPASLLWGDVRLGNVVFAPDAPAVAAVLDWEMAGAGPAESDLAWFTALEDLTARFTSATVPGFLPRDEVVARHEAAIGRSLRDFEWHERLALVRSAALGLRTQQLAARRKGRPPPPARGNPLVDAAAERF